MARYVDICERLLAAIAAGEHPPGTALPSVRELARREATAPATAARAYAALADAGAIVTHPRRAARVAPDGPARARRALRGGRVLVVAGSDDPLLDLLLARAAGAVERAQAARGSFGGLTALWRGHAEAAALHLWHRSGEHNAPYAARVLAGRAPVLVRLWRREQGIVVAPGNPRGVERAGDLAVLTVAQRAPGTGTRALTDRLLRERGVDPGAITGPQVDSHLDVALAVASGVAEAGVAVRAAAATAGLDFVPLAWEPFELALPDEAIRVAAPLLDALAEPAIRAKAGILGGYDLAEAGAARQLH